LAGASSDRLVVKNGSKTGTDVLGDPGALSDTLTIRPVIALCRIRIVPLSEKHGSRRRMGCVDDQLQEYLIDLGDGTHLGTRPARAISATSLYSQLATVSVWSSRG
jgi:hypothetical protein